ncbi:hypothetical protein EJ04DRAFT_524062 [Polyplosphaeria fusca]|uniref:Uncharacterized protein n=1 Tax=Polyplosphaeria fusca TaxID=682080 RepID=A0A9P4V261_9PLEO|nr:hypothetical protein EJ04DRAFT_524062 [Polyplosphaeria fusca]
MREYGSAYLRASGEPNGEGLVSPVHDASQYRPFRPSQQRQSSDENIEMNRLSGVSPIDLQQSLPPMPLNSEPSSDMRPSIFDSRATINFPYRESVAWANSTDFGPARHTSPPPQPQPTTAAPRSDTPNDGRKYFRHPRHMLEPWKIGFWARFPWIGFGALFSVLLRGSMELEIAPFPILEYFQHSTNDPRQQGGITSDLSRLLRGLNNGDTLVLNHPLDDCGEYCVGTIKGFGFKVDCSSTSMPFDLNSLPEECNACSSQQCNDSCASRLETDLSPTFFSINCHKNTSDTDEQTLSLTSVFKAEPSCKGDIQMQTCTLSQVTTDYTITISNGAIERHAYNPEATIYNDSLPISSLLMDKYWPLALEALFPPVAVNITPTDEDFLSLQYRKCVAPLQPQKDTNGSPLLTSCSTNPSLEAPLLANDPSVFYATPGQTLDNSTRLCNLTWQNPMQDMIDKMQSLAFRITLDMAQSNGSVFAPTYTNESLDSLRKDWYQPFSYTGSRHTTVYTTSKVLVAIAVLVSVVGVVAILPLYAGFWELGRKVSLNPLETARAFGAPLMEGMDGNASAGAVCLERGGMAVRWGVVERFGEEKRLRIEETARANVRMPWQGEFMA